MSLFQFLLPSKAFRDNWGHFFWMGWVAIGLSLIGGSLRLLPWFVAAEVMDFTLHITRNHNEEPRHPAMPYTHWSGILMTGFVILGMIIAPNVVRTYAASKISGAVVMAYVVLPLLVAQRIISKNIHLFVHGELKKMYNEDREKWIDSIAWDLAKIVTMLIASAGLQYMLIVR